MNNRDTWTCLLLSTLLTPAALCADDLLPRRLVFGNPDRTSPRISPDGKQLAFLAPSDGVMNVWVGPLDKPAAARPITRDAMRGIRQFFWAYTSEHILYAQDKGGDENWRIYCVETATGAERDLTPFDGVQARVQELSPQQPNEILIAINQRDRGAHDLERVNILTAERRPVAQNDRGFAAFVTDEELRVRFGLATTPDGGAEWLRREGDDWKTFITVDPEDEMTTSPVGFDKSGDTLYLYDSRGRNTAALAALQLSDRQVDVIAADVRSDVSASLIHPTEKHVQAVAFEFERQEWKVIDPAVAPDFEKLGTIARGDFNIVSRSYDDRHWIVADTLADGPTRFYHYDRTTRGAALLFTDRSALENRTLARMHPVTIRARDGLALVSYLSLPPALDPQGAGRPKQPLPLVLVVHGGPWARDRWGFNPTHQWLASRGYAVLSVNFRGSIGFGKDFVNAGDREWAARMHDDLLDAVDWAVREKIADPQRVGVMGGSYGGYATLVGLTFTPQTFACGVSIVGPSNLITLLESIPPYWKPLLNKFARRVGDPRTPEGRALLTERSPLSRVERIVRPLLIGQGANDPRVKQSESDQIVAAMNQRSIPVTYVLYPDEGHGFVRPENRLSFFAIAEAFFAQHLGGVAEPIGDDFRDSSLKVPAGAAHIPALRIALPASP